MWNAKMQLHARMFYTADALGRLEELHMPLFSAMNVDRKRFDDADEIAEFFAKYGVSDEDFRKAFDSFGVKTAVRQADARARAFRITGTPEVVVAGKYKVSGKYVQNMGEMVEVIDYLVDRERRERAAATTAAVN
jgi:thiol:disulfide interchange protein DsbA